MKKLAFYAGLMIAIIILLPLLIVRGCGHPAEKSIPPVNVPKAAEVKICVYDNASKRTFEMPLEEYIKGVTAAEMPADFDLEALKAQAVAARTFAVGRMTGTFKSKEGVHDGIDICTDSTHCQAWESKDKALKKWKIFFANRNWNKIEKAVIETKGMIVVYKGTVANTLFHASSGGKTENSQDVWAGVAVPYLRSVESEGEENSRGYVTTVKISEERFLEKLREKYPDEKFDRNVTGRLRILDHTEGGRVKTLKIGKLIMKGTEFRSLFQLRSAKFRIEPDGDGNLNITTTGYGHGVGMSQWGADSLAKKGGTYVEILKHYYTGVNIVPLSGFLNRDELE